MASNSMPTTEQRRAQWLKGVLDVCVLALLGEREAYGYELAQRLDDAGLGPIKGGTLYPLLRRLEQQGLVAASWRASSEGPDRKYYRLTEQGEQAANDVVSDWSDFVGSTDLLVTRASVRREP